MYPYKAAVSSSLVRDEWYVVALTQELAERTKPLARTVLGTPVAVFRDSAGHAAMLDSACPHRSYPLADSPIVGDEIQCGYHGIRFDTSGRCTFVPGWEPNDRLRVRSYPLVERSGFVWAWLGDPDRADATRIPGLGRPEIDDPGWYHLPQVFYEVIAARSIMLLENLMDLSHLSYLHGDVIKDTSIADRRLDVEEDGDAVTAIRRMDAAPIGGLEAALYGAVPGSGVFDWDNLSTYLSPSLVVTGVHPRTPAPDGFGDFRFLHAVTPETEVTTHYWAVTTRDFRPGDPQVDGVFMGMNSVVPLQDKAALEAIERMPEHVKRAERYQHFDKGALHVRHRIERRLMEEQGLLSRAAV